MECRSILENPIYQFVISFFKHLCEKYVLRPTLISSRIWLMFVRCVSLKKKEKPSQGRLNCYWFTDSILFFSVMLSLLWWFATSCKQVLSALAMLLHLTCQRGPVQHVWCDMQIVFYCEPQFSGNAGYTVTVFSDLPSLSHSAMTTITPKLCAPERRLQPTQILVKFIVTAESLCQSHGFLFFFFLFVSMSQGSY